jgi:D-amino-acid dehydrogenase
VVVGGGILGAAAAYHLAREGVTTLVVDARQEGHATWAGAGIVCPVTATVGEPRLVDLAFSAAAHYPVLAEWLAADLGSDGTGFARVGMLSVSVGGSGARQVAATASWADGMAAHDRYGAMAGARVVPGDEAQRRCPVLAADVDAAVLVEWAGRVDGNRFRDVLLAAAVGRGAVLRPGTVESVAAGREGARVWVDGEVINVGWAVLAAGAWTGRLWPLGGALGATRGEIAHVALAGLSTDGWPLVEVEGSGPYIVPWAGGRLGVGATVVPTGDLDPRPTLSGLRWLTESLARATVGLEEAKLVECRVGFRPASKDGLPVIGPAVAVDGGLADRVLLATGHNANGLSWGPYTGQLVAELVTGQAPAIDLSPFAPARFGPPGQQEGRA